MFFSDARDKKIATSSLENDRDLLAIDIAL